MTANTTRKKSPIYLIQGGSQEASSRIRALEVRNERVKCLTALALLLPITIFLCFATLSAPSFHHRDETTHVRVTQEMLMHGKYFEPSSFGIGYYNKPPFKMWLSIVPTTLLGESNFSYRFLDALAGLGTTLLVFFFARSLFSSSFAGLIAGLALISCRAYAVSHGYRSANQDSLLIFFATATSILGWYFVQSNTLRTRYLLALLGGVVIGCAALTKNVAGFIPLAPLALFLLFRGNFVSFLKDAWRPLLLLGALAVFIPALYVIPKCLTNPGACAVMFGDEVVTRATEGYHNQQNYRFYFIRLFRDRVAVPPFLLLLGIGVAGYSVFRRGDERFLYLLLWVGVIVSVFTAIPSRLTWYIAPAYPAMAVLAGGAMALALRVVLASGVRWWRGKSPLTLSVVGSGLSLCFGIGFLGQHVTELTSIISNPPPRAQFDLLIEDLQGYFSSPEGSSGRLIIFRSPELARNETVYRDFLANRIVAVSDESQLRLELEKKLPDIVLADPHYFSLVHQARSFSSYLFLPPYKARTDWIFVGAFNEQPPSSLLTPAKQVVSLARQPETLLFGWGKRQPLGKLLLRQSKGAQSGVLLPSDLAYRQLGGEISINGARAHAIRGVPVKVTLLLNGKHIGETAWKSSRVDTARFVVPAANWESGKNVLTLIYSVEGREIGAEDPAVVVNWISVRPLG